ncbi:hypothetical protein FXO38_11788 [Capsicum annuum]|nr:hypothetical protein FXO38_11788 [Capsicum annuum]KAF3663443.1 hypothetical protein FXO37_11987 [Capsicum annuum]
MDDQSSIWISNGDKYFTLGDLWNCYEEWSSYGVGAPIRLKDDDDENVIQYYSPYLSAIQIYTIRSPSSPISEYLKSRIALPALRITVT